MTRTLSSLSFLVAALIVCDVSDAAGAPECKPVLTVKGTTFSDMRQWRRTWVAHIAVDASHCAVSSGRFAIDFIRLKEDAPDLGFSESFTWMPGEIDSTTIFAADEAVLEYSIRPASCPCRE
jgi:hypothetical protein